jgi:hypothetical protein
MRIMIVVRLMEMLRVVSTWMHVQYYISIFLNFFSSFINFKLFIFVLFLLFYFIFFIFYCFFNIGTEEHSFNITTIAEDSSVRMQSIRGRKGWGDRSVGHVLAAIDERRTLPFHRYTHTLPLLLISSLNFSLIFILYLYLYLYPIPRTSISTYI